MLSRIKLVLPITLTLLPEISVASEAYNLHATTTPLAIACIGVFVLAYIAVMAEEVLHLRKSKPVILGAGIIWIMVAIVAQEKGVSHHELHQAISHSLQEYSELFLFLLVAMTYINAMEERNVFAALRAFLVKKGLNYRQLFWATGGLAFVISPIADNLTTALLMGAVIIAIGQEQPRFITLAMINVVVAANAGGAFSPFGDITTLMVWQSGKLAFLDFFVLFVPSVVNFIIPALIMSLFLPKGQPSPIEDNATVLRGGRRVCILFLLTIALAVSFEQFFELPPFMGMMTGMSLLMFFSYFLQVTNKNHADGEQKNGKEIGELDIFLKVARAEWDTLLFFFGIIFCVSGLGYLGYLELLSDNMYNTWGPTAANIAAGTISAVIDNIPVMFAILSMNPEMDNFQWLLITMTAGVGGSLLSVGSAAGVALMGQARGHYTFLSHLRWSWAILLGYAASIAAHFWING